MTETAELTTAINRDPEALAKARGTVMEAAAHQLPPGIYGVFESICEALGPTGLDNKDYASIQEAINAEATDDPGRIVPHHGSGPAGLGPQGTGAGS